MLRICAYSKICTFWRACINGLWIKYSSSKVLSAKGTNIPGAMLRLQILRYFFLWLSLKVGLKVSATQNDAQCTFLIMNAFYTHCCIKCLQILQEKTLLQMYTDFTCIIYNKILFYTYNYLTPEIELIYYSDDRFQDY